jgi:uncharacterized membrane protein
VKPRTQLEKQVQRWTDAGVIDSQTGSSILAFEAGQERRATLRWPVILAMVFGGILLAAGVTLFVAAHWIELSPAVRFTLLILMVGVFHAGGTALTTRFPHLSTTLRALGTATLGAAIFLTAQIFNLHENWATGVLLWAMGAAAGYVLLRDWPQAALLAVLAPTWLISQWSITTKWHYDSDRLLGVGLILTALCYLSARVGDEESTARRTLVWIGGLALFPCVGTAVALAIEESYTFRYNNQSALPTATLLLGWAVAFLAPLLLALWMRGREAWANLLWAAWAYALVLAAARSSPGGPARHPHSFSATLALYFLCALGSIGMVAWGLNEKRKERVNLGIAAFALSVLFFYFDSFMGKIGRSASLLLLGVLCLAGGYALEITRRRLMTRMETSQ